MDGIEILNMISIPQMHPMAIFGVILLMFGVFLFMISLAADEHKIAIAFLVMALIGMCLMLCTKELEPKIQYEVTIDESVSYKELTDKYNIIEQRGEIFVLEEKESNETSLLSGGEYK